MPQQKLKSKFSDAYKSRKRIRDLGIKIGFLPTGKLNNINDVKGVRVGQATIVEGTGRRKTGGGPVRTGVTVIHPAPDVFENKVVAGSFVLNGAGEMSGLIQVNEWGLIETPIALTNTMSVGRVADSMNKWMAQKHARIWDDQQVVIPVVGECDDSYLNDSVGLHIKTTDVFEALNSATSGPIQEGSVGAGTGMVCCDLKGGIGSSSRVFKIDENEFTIGILVETNFGTLEDLRIDGFPMGRIIRRKWGEFERRTSSYGSIIVVIATDLPLTSGQISRLCKRAGLGVGRVGSYAAHGSGEIIVGFSTANRIPHVKKHSLRTFKYVGDHSLDLAYQAVIEATEEAILNALTMAVDTDGIDGHFVRAIDLDLLKAVFEEREALIDRL